MRHGSAVGVADDVDTLIPKVAGVSLGALHQSWDKVTNPQLKAALDRVTLGHDDPISPFGSFIPRLAAEPIE